MVRKSKGKFIMNLKGFPSNNLEDGRPGSSAFQQEEDPVDNKEIIESDPLDKPKTVLGDDTEYNPDLEWEEPGDEGQREFSGKKEGWGYAAFELAQLAKRRKAAKAKKALAEQEELDRLNEEAIEQSHLENEYQQSGVYDENLDEFGNPIEPPPTETPQPEFKNLQKEHTVKGYTITDDKNEMTDLREEIRNIGTWDPKTNFDHAKIQNKINELYDSDVRYPVE